jgi:hypothetical protein
MHSIRRLGPSSIEFTKIIESEEDVLLLREHVKEIVAGAAFRGSHRSGQFLQYVIEQGVEGNFDSLKERVIGMELFGRSPSYDTGGDAIVRVTASDVRKRLLQHYGMHGTGAAGFRISLPPGSYIPEITRESNGEPELVAASASAARVEIAAHQPQADLLEHDLPAPTADTIVLLPPPVAPEVVTPVPGRRKHLWLTAGVLITIVNLSVWGFFWYRFDRKPEVLRTLPWSALLNSSHALQLITSDPDIAEVQGYSHQELSVSDYATHNYIPNPAKLTPEIRQLCQKVLRDNKAALVDTPIAAAVAALAQSASKKVDVHSARMIELSSLRNDDNFILLGSPLSNPWTGFFSDQLNFRFFMDKTTGQEAIRNLHPKEHERAEYVPTALGWATGESYAIIALVRNPDRNGNVLLLSGANAEGTEAAGRLMTDPPRLKTVLEGCGITPGGPLRPFEMLLHFSMMAGYPTNVSVEACHYLPGTLP